MKQIKYNEAIKEIERIIAEIEQDELDVDLLAKRLERASELLKFCKAKLRATEEEVDRIIENLDTD